MFELFIVVLRTDAKVTCVMMRLDYVFRMLRIILRSTISYGMRLHTPISNMQSHGCIKQSMD
jgi:hypothetical protein